MFLSTLFGVKPVDEADEASTERGYPSKQIQCDNTALDSITFTPTLQESQMARLAPEINKMNENEIGNQRLGSKEAKQNANSVGVEYQGLAKQGQELAIARGQKLYKCKYCKEKFTWATRLQKHLHSHENAYMEATVKEGDGEKKGMGGIEEWGGTWMNSIGEGK
jgi:hypothetical protein